MHIIDLAISPGYKQDEICDLNGSVVTALSAV